MKKNIFYGLSLVVIMGINVILLGAAGKGAKVGKIDVNKISTNSTASKQLNVQIQAKQRQWEEFLQFVGSTTTATPDQLEKLKSCLFSGSPVNITKTVEIKNEILKSDNERRKLMQNSNADKNSKDSKLKEYAKNDEERAMYSRSIRRVYSEYMENLSQKARQEFFNHMQKCLNSVAAKDGYSEVFTSEVLMYSANDITDKVVEEMNKSCNINLNTSE